MIISKYESYTEHTEDVTVTVFVSSIKCDSSKMSLSPDTSKSSQLPDEPLEI